MPDQPEIPAEVVERCEAAMGVGLRLGRRQMVLNILRACGYAEMREALEEIAKQKLVSEMADADEPTYGDVEVGYEECVKRARRALAGERG